MHLCPGWPCLRIPPKQSVHTYSASQMTSRSHTEKVPQPIQGLLPAPLLAHLVYQTVSVAESGGLWHLPPTRLSCTGLWEAGSAKRGRLMPGDACAGQALGEQNEGHDSHPPTVPTSTATTVVSAWAPCQRPKRQECGPWWFSGGNATVIGGFRNV